MEAGFILLTVGIAVVTFGLGVLIGSILNKTKADTTGVYGIVHIDCSDTSCDPWMYLEASVPIEELGLQKRVTFNVNVIR